jgi:serine/threonine protein kinase
LVNKRGQPCICDFGLSRMLVDNALWNTSATSSQGTLRWMAPEMLSGDIPLATKASDVYAFAMTSYVSQNPYQTLCLIHIKQEVLTGKIPFFHLSRDPWVISAVTRGDRPPRPKIAGLPDTEWAMIVHCWSARPGDRPSISSAARQSVLDCCENKQP